MGVESKEKPKEQPKEQPKKKQTSGHLSEEIEESMSTLPNMDISHLYFLYQKCPSEATKSQLLANVEKYQMSPFYEKLCAEFKWKLDTNLLNKMRTNNDEELKKIEAQYEDAVANLGDIEVLETLLAKARTYSTIGDKENVLEALKVASEKPQSINQKIIIALHTIRIGLFFNDLEIVETFIKKATALIDEGGDWDRRNRLKVYEGCYLLMIRDFKKASKLFQESVATFTSTELMTYSQMIFYCVITCVLCMSRVDLKSKIVDAPEILGVILEIPHISDFLNGLYECNYKRFFEAMVSLEPYIHQDKYLSGHSRYMYRELRVLAYSQFLEAYRSVTMQSMANAFGVGVPFLDNELSRFIAAGRLNAKIDKVAGIIETNRPDSKNAQYQETIKKGDLLLNRVQKLARIINV